MACEQRSPPTLGMGSANPAIVDSGANNGPICANGIKQPMNGSYPQARSAA